MCNFEREEGARQLYILSVEDGNIVMLLSKVTHDIPMAGKPTISREIAETRVREFTLIKTIADGPIIYNGCRINRNEKEDIKPSTEDYFAAISPTSLCRGRRKEWEAIETKREALEYSRCSGSLAGSVKFYFSRQP